MLRRRVPCAFAGRRDELHGAWLGRNQVDTRTNARMGRVGRNWAKFGGMLILMAGGFVTGQAYASPTLSGTMPFRVAISTAPDPQDQVGST